MNGYTVFRNTIIVLCTIALGYLFVATIDVWVVLIVAILIASALRPLVIWLKRWRISESAAIIIIYGVFFFGSAIILVAVAPPVVNQFVTYMQNEDRLANRIVIAQYWVERILNQLTRTEVEIGIPPAEIRSAVRDVVETIRVTAPNLIDDVGNFLSNAILIFVMGAYWITSRQKAEDFILELMPISRQPQVRAIMQEVEFGLGAYVRGLVLISAIVGVMCFAALVLFGVSNAASLAFLYSLATAIPIIGGLIGVVLCTALALLSSPTSALIVLVVTVILQQIENYYLSPRIVSKSTSSSEILIIIFIAIGFSLNGIAGALISVPVAGTAVILLKHLVLEPRRNRIKPSRAEGGVLITPSEPT